MELRLKELMLFVVSDDSSELLNDCTKTQKKIFRTANDLISTETPASVTFTRRYSSYPPMRTLQSAPQSL
jgi:hypothetical protein